jgi:hypothetical protein
VAVVATMAVAAGVTIVVAAGHPARSGATLDDLLTRQSAALLAGDEAGFLAAVQTADAVTTTLYRTIYNNLRTLQVIAFDQSAPGQDVPITRSTGFTITMSYCLRIAVCEKQHVTLAVTAVGRDGAAHIVSATPPAPGRYRLQPYPWEAAALHIVMGSRVVLASADDEAALLPALLPIAEHAAAIADSFAAWGRPARYLIYLASRADAGTWFGGAPAGKTGVTVQVAAHDMETMVIVSRQTTTATIGAALAFVLQHELGHVATLPGAAHYKADTLVEGLAEYIGYVGAPETSTTFEMDAVRTYLAGGHWSGDCYLTTHVNDPDPIVAEAVYGIGYLTVTYLMAQYGRDRTLALFGAVERDGDSLDTAARDVFATSWSAINSACAGYVRHAVGIVAAG